MIPSRSLRFSILGVFFLTTAAPALADAQILSAKVDRAVRESQQAGAQTQSVIISVQPGYRDALKEALQQHGDVISAEMADALTVELHSGDIDEIANQPWIDSVAADSTVYAGAVPYTGTLEKTSASVAAPRSLVRLKNVLRTTLGLAPVASSTIDGSGIGVAIVDS